MDEADEGEVEWEEEEEVEPKIGDGGDGGGVILGDLPWGERVLNIAKEMLLQFNDDVKLFSFKATHRGYIYVRLDKLSNKYGCPSMDEIEEFNNVYKKKLDEVGEQGHIRRDLAIEVSSPGAERLLKVPGDLERFKDLPMQVTYVEDDLKSRNQQQVGVFLLESVEADEGYCMWRLANVKENRDALGKGRPLSRKQKEWRLKLPFQHIRLVKLYLEC
ncbi:Ribosome maturation factor [Nymphaea thermarum]|nr:Ribosome maturation factor [Nymphaea thermarum]